MIHYIHQFNELLRVTSSLRMLKSCFIYGIHTTIIWVSYNKDELHTTPGISLSKINMISITCSQCHGKYCVDDVKD